MAQKKHKKSRCSANGIPLTAKLARQCMIREAVDAAAHDATVRVEADPGLGEGMKAQFQDLVADDSPVWDIENNGAKKS